jgi:hypothetical protein
MTTTQEELLASAGAAAAKAPLEVPADIKARAAEAAKMYEQKVRDGLDRRAEARLQAQLRGANLGEPVVGPYVAFDLLALTPIQFGGPPPYQPSRILAGGELAVIFAFLFVNPTVDIPNGFAIPPTVQLSSRTYRVNMEQINLTDVTNGPDMHKQDVFGAPADSVTTLAFWFTAPQPAQDPLLMEANFTADIVGAAQPYAAFASTIIDVDAFQVLDNVAVRYLVYAQ